jgi:tetratricopeptide (TPR) repeat protein
MEDKIKFQKELLAFETFLASYPIPVYKSFVSAWNAKVTYWNGEIEKSLQQLDMAIEESKQSIISLRTNNIVDQFIYSKAEIMFELGNTQGALEEVDLLLSRNPLFAKAHYLNAKIFKSQNNIAQAEISIQKAIEIWNDADANFVDLQKLHKLEK